MDTQAVAAASNAPGATEKESREYVAPRLCGEQRLFLAVLNQAVIDATFTDASANGYSRKERNELLKQRSVARAWLCRRSHDLDIVCDGAGVNPDKLLEQARELRARGWQ